MKSIKLLFSLFIFSLFFTACTVTDSRLNEPEVTLEEVITQYDIWYVDIHQKEGTGDVPFLSNAFTITFVNGKLYANNNLVGFGTTGSKYGVKIGTYNTQLNFLKVGHFKEGGYEFVVKQLDDDTLELVDEYHDVSYVLEGYSSSTFDWDKVFYENIEYFLQEYDLWKKTGTGADGDFNDFDKENFLSFTAKNNTTFYSSKDKTGTDIANIIWDFEGAYSIADYKNVADVKELTLNYGNGDLEVFDLHVLTDHKIKLFHIASGTSYYFEGVGYIPFMKKSAEKISTIPKGRKRTKIKRVQKIRTER